MGRRWNKSSKSNWQKLGTGRQAVNSVAARVAGEGVTKPRHEQLVEKAKRTENEEKRAAILAEARATRKSYADRLVSKSAERKARKALERAKWLAQDKKW